MEDKGAKELVDRMRRHGVAVCGIQEHRRVHDGTRDIVVTNMKISNLSPHRLGEMKHRQQLVGNPVLTAIVAYAPTLLAPYEEKRKFYDDLRRAVEAVPQYHFLAILGDFNARLGQGDVPFTFHQVTNDNGVRMPDLIEDYSLLVNNTMFEKRKGRLWALL
ncbi:craniofacial development protein 2-like [Patiria miniata]|uniref:Endonuclease/exonuclease/phosphatase domain-containing protein n=1 Tax=Patiria miniata TaxID=46514 RepID=A0A913ZM41_PATMI|nr:craniofacial development protein 2-like [Patiria miniata]